jgi:MFS family permease
LIADLSKPGLLGRYLALNGFGFQLGGAAGRAAGGFALALIPHGLWLVAAAAAFAAGLSALLLERVLPEGLRRTPQLATESA